MMNETGAKHALGEGGAPPNPETQRYYALGCRATEDVARYTQSAIRPQPPGQCRFPVLRSHV